MDVGGGVVFPRSGCYGCRDCSGTALGLIIGVGIADLAGFTAELAVVSTRILTPLSDILQVFETLEQIGEESGGDGLSEEEGGEERDKGRRHFVRSH